MSSNEAIAEYRRPDKAWLSSRMLRFTAYFQKKMRCKIESRRRVIRCFWFSIGPIHVRRSSVRMSIVVGPSRIIDGGIRAGHFDGSPLMAVFDRRKPFPPMTSRFLSAWCQAWWQHRSMEIDGHRGPWGSEQQLFNHTLEWNQLSTDKYHSVPLCLGHDTGIACSSKTWSMNFSHPKLKFNFGVMQIQSRSNISGAMWCKSGFQRRYLFTWDVQYTECVLNDSSTFNGPRCWMACQKFQVIRTICYAYLCIYKT